HGRGPGRRGWHRDRGERDGRGCHHRCGAGSTGLRVRPGLRSRRGQWRDVRGDGARSEAHVVASRTSAAHARGAHARGWVVDRSQGGMKVPLTQQAQTVLDMMTSLGFTGLELDADPAEVRALYESSIVPSSIAIEHVEDRSIPGPAGDIPVRIYRPAGPSP